MTATQKSLHLFILCLAIVFSMPTFASDDDEAIATCLKSWGKHPFGDKPQYKTLSSTVKVFGMGGGDPSDTEVTDTPSLVLVNPGLNVMGSTTYEILNPNGWYCFRTSASVMGDITIKAHCKAHIASTTTGVAVDGTGKQGVTVMGSTEIERVGCK